MTWIEGVGDEVPIFFVLAAIIIVAFMVLAWKSTDVPEQPLSIPVLTFTISSRETTTVSSQITNDDGPPLIPEESLANQEVPLTLNPDLISSHQATGRNSSSQLETGEETNVEPETSTEDKGNNLRKRVTESSATCSEDVISVKLMYMDDTNRVVESPLHSTIGDFKKKHFRNELNASKVVKLIFNGQVLNEDSTLSQLGLDNNCVVHCLIHQPRSTNTVPLASTTTLPGSSNNTVVEDQVPRISNQQSAAEAGIDIGGLLVPLFGVILGLVWYCRIAYATHFTAAATTALVGFSGLCVFSFFIIWYPTAEQEGG